MKLLYAAIFLLLSAPSFAQSCNRTRPDDGDYVLPREFCDDDASRHKLPAFTEFPAAPVPASKPVLPTRIEGGSSEDNAAWLKRIEDTLPSGKGRFAGHYMIAERGGCGAGCHRAVIVDLSTGLVHQPKEIGLMDASVNPLPETMCKKLGMDCQEILAYRPDSKLLLVVADLGLKPNKHGLYHFQWDANRLKLVSRVERSRNATR